MLSFNHLVLRDNLAVPDTDDSSSRSVRRGRESPSDNTVSVDLEMCMDERRDAARSSRCLSLRRDFRHQRMLMMNAISKIKAPTLAPIIKAACLEPAVDTMYGSENKTKSVSVIEMPTYIETGTQVWPPSLYDYHCALLSSVYVKQKVAEHKDLV